MRGKLRISVSLLAVALCVVFGAMLTGCYDSAYTPEEEDDEQVIYEPVHYEPYEDVCEKQKPEPTPSPPTEPSFEVVYEIKVESRTPGNPPGRFVFSNEPVAAEEAGSTHFRRYTKHYFPAGTVFAFISDSDDTLREVYFSTHVHCSGINVPVSLVMYGYEFHLTEVMMGFTADIRVIASSYESIHIGVYHPPWEYLFPPRDEAIPPTYLRFELNSITYTLNEEPRELVTAPFIDDDTGLIMLPAQALADAFGYFVEVLEFGFRKPVAVFYCEPRGGTFLMDLNLIDGRTDPITLVRNPDVSLIGECLFVSVFALRGTTAHNRTMFGYVRFIGDGIYVWESEDAAREWQRLMN
ncbi:MAG: copper amine oxidase N-terminal domain-containing protein [Defluviitaleaceae bacterium]|nr:copper amine oxidase N-terminal domain-containing protein [Defluviitaleaceae bacterium]